MLRESLEARFSGLRLGCPLTPPGGDPGTVGFCLDQLHHHRTVFRLRVHPFAAFIPLNLHVATVPPKRHVGGTRTHDLGLAW